MTYLQNDKRYQYTHLKVKPMYVKQCKLHHSENA